MTQTLYTPEQVAEYLMVSPSKVAKLLRSRQLGCAYVGSVRRVTEAHIAEYIKLAASRPPRKRRARPSIPTDLAPVWQRLSEIALQNYPLLAPFMQEAKLASIDTRTRIATVTTVTEHAATVIMADQNRYALQRCLRTIFMRHLLIRVTCSK
jgi:excisionase family DNA binding protein